MMIKDHKKFKNMVKHIYDKDNKMGCRYNMIRNFNIIYPGTKYKQLVKYINTHRWGDCIDIKNQWRLTNILFEFYYDYDMIYLNNYDRCISTIIHILQNRKKLYPLIIRKKEIIFKELEKMMLLLTNHNINNLNEYI